MAKLLHVPLSGLLNIIVYTHNDVILAAVALLQWVLVMAVITVLFHAALVVVRFHAAWSSSDGTSVCAPREAGAATTKLHIPRGDPSITPALRSPSLTRTTTRQDSH